MAGKKAWATKKSNSPRVTRTKSASEEEYRARSRKMRAQPRNIDKPHLDMGHDQCSSSSVLIKPHTPCTCLYQPTLATVPACGPVAEADGQEATATRLPAF